MFFVKDRKNCFHTVCTLHNCSFGKVRSAKKRHQVLQELLPLISVKCSITILNSFSDSERNFLSSTIKFSTNLHTLTLTHNRIKVLFSIVKKFSKPANLISCSPYLIFPTLPFKCLSSTRFFEPRTSESPVHLAQCNLNPYH